MTSVPPGLPRFPSPPRGALFDLDGSLVDTESLHFASTNEVLDDFDVSLALPEFLPFIGWAELPFWEALRQRFNLQPSAEELANHRERRFLELLHEVRIVPLLGARAILARMEAARIPVAIASSSTRAQIEAILRAADIDTRIRATCSGHDDVARGKPAPDVYLKAAELIGVPASQCFAVEDSATGVAAAQAAGAFTVAIPCASHPDPDLGAADLQLESLLDLRPYLDAAMAADPPA